LKGNLNLFLYVAECWRKTFRVDGLHFLFSILIVIVIVIVIVILIFILIDFFSLLAMGLIYF